MRKDGDIQSGVVAKLPPSLGATARSQAATVEAGLFREGTRTLLGSLIMHAANSGELSQLTSHCFT